jgi:hypothetical protein
MVRRSPASALEEFWRLYRAGQYFDAHEVLEDAWREEKGVRRERLHGLIHAAVARHHHEKGNAEGAARQTVRAHVRLENFAEDADFLSELAAATAPSLAALDAGARERLRQLEVRLKQEKTVQYESAAESGSTLED